MLLPLLTFIVINQCVNALVPELTLPTGRLEGYLKKTENGKVYAAFEGIPYARPPVGKHRFEEPKPMKPWSGTWEAKTLTKCMQYLHYTQPESDVVVGDEDCLHVNVYTPQAGVGRMRDVIVYIHGGAFMFNSGGSYGERYIMEYDVVFVSFNYRLGPLGFLSTEDRYVPGNNGLKDQLMALRWVKENIRYFGGNPDSITLCGMSAGGASVHIHTLSPRTQDVQLFQKAIAQSGSALNPWVMAEKSREKAVKLGALVGCPGYDIKDMIKCMKYRPGRQIVSAVKHFQPWLYNPFSPFGVVVDKWSMDPVLPYHPYAILKNKFNVLNVPIIFSNVESEGLYPGADFLHHLEELDARWDDLIPFILDFNNTVNPEQILEVGEKIRKFYFEDKPITKNTYRALLKIITDRLFLVDNERAVRMHAAAISEPTYYYSYSYRAANSKSDSRTKTRDNFGCSHGDDTIMILSTNINTTSTPDDRAMSAIMQNLWISFAKHGMPKIDNVNWETVSRTLEGPLNYLEINNPTDIKMQSANYIGNRENFWDTLPINENQNIKSIRDEL